MSRIQLTDADYRMAGLSLSSHPAPPATALSPTQSAPHMTTDERPRRQRVAHAGLVIVRQRPNGGFVFLRWKMKLELTSWSRQAFERQAL
jgi:hypothetical protein